MARQSDDERDALKKAADAVAPILTRLRQKRRELDERITRLEAVMIAYKREGIGKRTRTEFDPESGEPIAQTVMAKMPRGQVKAHINAVLEAGAIYSLPDLRKAIFDRFGIRYNRPTVYSALRRGAREGIFEQKEGSWRLAG